VVISKPNDDSYSINEPKPKKKNSRKHMKTKSINGMEKWKKNLGKGW